ncbi:hypothetical protein [Pseudoalteromonas piscicida]|uniref:Uncharacterized protein n=1 Tax=Pseudoalteromonas piscicida TaxID=43662 RepID=A0AAD0RGP1_PSEO7|nr:hypothetical protein [Pseudoalteromonas piscicida]ASD67974.1 hypothetical protein B1L02_13815 [Pseudoalteromonas piscicida]AXQ98907.1 hypothetical protein D0N37_15095 [Pseudoalteromonas piscicida]AXR01319.1 hypothetical protein D0511_03920 [Pseudoalteromonas piscicida]
MSIIFNTLISFFTGITLASAYFIFSTNQPQVAESINKTHLRTINTLQTELAQIESKNSELQKRLVESQTKRDSNFANLDNTDDLQSTFSQRPKPELSAPRAVSLDNLKVVNVMPTVSHLSAEMELDDVQKVELQEALMAKANQDYEIWEHYQATASSDPTNAPQIRADFEYKLQNNAKSFATTVSSLLSADQIKQYRAFELREQKLLVSQKLAMLQNELNKIVLSEYQKQEVSRLSQSVFSAPSDITLGTAGSPYAKQQVSTDFEKLAEIKSLFNEQQLQQFTY